MVKKLDKLIAGDDGGIDDNPPITRLDPKPPEGQPAQPAKPDPIEPAPPKGKENKDEKKPIRTLSEIKKPQAPEGQGDPDDKGAGADDLDSDDVPPSIKSPKAADDFRKIKGALRDTSKNLEAKELALKQAESELAKLRQQIEQSSAGAVDTEKLVKERDSLLEQLETVALERSERFNSKYEPVFADAIARAKDAVPADSGDKIVSLMSLPPSKWRNKQIEEIRESVETGVEKAQLDLAVADMDKTRALRDRELKNSKEAYAKLQESEKAELTAKSGQQQARISKMEKEAMELAALSSAFDEIEGSKENNELVKGRIQRIKDFISGKADDSTVVRTAVLAEENLWLTQYYIPAIHEKLNELEGQLKGIHKASPTMGSGTLRPTQQKQTGRKTFTEKFLENWEEPYQ